MTEAKIWVLTVWSKVWELRTVVLLWASFLATFIALFELITDNNAWRSFGWAFIAAVLIVARWLALHDEQIANMNVVQKADQQLREAVVAHQAKLERDIALLRSQLDIHIRSTTAGVRPRPTPYKRTH
jgi:hypothetical protein